MSAGKTSFSFLACFLTIFIVAFLMSCTLQTNNGDESVFTLGKEYTFFSTQTISNMAVQALKEDLDNLYLLYDSTQTTSQRDAEDTTQLFGLYVMESEYGTYSKATETLSDTLEGSDQFLFVGDTICYRKGSTVGSSDLSGTINWETDFSTGGKTILSIGGVEYDNTERLGILFRQNENGYYLVLNQDNGTELFRETFNYPGEGEIYYGPFTFCEKTLILLQDTLLYKEGVLIAFDFETDEKIISVFLNEADQYIFITCHNGTLFETGYDQNGNFLFRTSMTENNIASRDSLNLLTLPLLLAKGNNSAYFATCDSKIHQITTKNKANEGGDPPDEFQINFSEQPPEETTATEIEVTIESSQPVTYFRSYISPEGGGSNDFKENMIPVTEKPAIVNGKYQYQIKFKFDEAGKKYRVELYATNSKADNSGNYNLSNDLSFEINVRGGAQLPAIQVEEPLPEITTEATLNLKLLSDQVLNELRVTNNGLLNTFNNPQGEVVQTPDGNNYRYNAPLELNNGANEVKIEGENENGTSNKLEHTVERGERPVIEFAEQPPSQVEASEDNCIIIKINVQNDTAALTGLTHQVGDEASETLSPPILGTDLSGYYQVAVSLKEGSNTITFIAENKFGSSNTISCTIECVIPQSGGYTVKETVGQEIITQPVDITFDYYDTDYGVLVISQFQNQIGLMGQIYKISAQRSQVLQYYPETGGYLGVQGVACGLSDNNTLFLQKSDFIARTNGDGVPVDSYPISENQQIQTGQIDRYGNQIRYLSRDTSGYGFDYLNFLSPNDTTQNKGFSVTGNAGCDSISSSDQHSGKVLMTNTTATSGQRDTESYVSVTAEDGSTEKLFDIPETDGIPMDISFIYDYPDYHLLISTQRDNGYWINIYTVAGTKTHDFKTHDLVPAQSTGDQRAIGIYTAIKGEYDDYIYVINSLYPGVQIWEPVEE